MVHEGVEWFHMCFCDFVLCDFICKKSSDQFIGLIVMSHWLDDVWIWIRGNFICFTFIFLSVGESRLLVSWCACGRCRGPEMLTQVGYSVAERSGGWVTLCAVCIVHVETMSASFLVEPQNQYQCFGLKITGTIYLWFDLKTSRTVSFDLTSKLRWWMIFRFGS
jgi:hypothetical protein